MDASSTTEPFRFSADVAAGLHCGAAAGGIHRAASGGAESGPPESESLVLETKREIRRLVQGIASLCHSRIALSRFWPRFLADVTSAMAADGGILWQRQEGGWVSLAHHGSIDRRLLRTDTCHHLMILEVGDGGGPVIVPPGGRWETAPDEAAADESASPLEPGNPSEFLAAVVPVPVDPDEPVEWMVELFLPVGGGPATHRGYLRFAAQMADLAADYLRRERLRDARFRADRASRMHEAVVSLHRAENRTAAEQRIVDAAAEVFSAERVSLVVRRNRRWAVVAVSGVEQIDPALPAVQAIRDIAAEVAGPGGFLPAEPEMGESDPARDEDPSPADDGVPDESSESRLTLRGVAILESHEDARLVVEDRRVVEVDAEQQQRWKLFLTHTEILLRQFESLRRAGLAGWLRGSRFGVPVPSGRTFATVALAVGLLVLAALPVPMVVTADARLEPRAVQTLYAPRDSVVAEIWVEHGQEVQPGDRLVRLVDPELNRSISVLVGRRAVLNERSAEIRSRLISRSANDADEAERLQTEQQVTNEELRSVTAELTLLNEERDRLVLRSDRSGIVDAWQVHQRLEDRPMRRGQSLFRVVAPEGGWLIEADVPQNRLDHVIAAEQKGPTTAEIVLAAFPDRSVTGQLERIGPATQFPTGSRAADPAVSSLPTGTVTFSIAPEELPLLQPGAPAKVGIDCGYRPLAYVACQDLVRMVVGGLRLYW